MRTVLEGGAWAASPRGRLRVHRHPELEFNLVLRGTARYLVGDRRYDLGPGTLVWLFPGQRHVLVHRSPNFRVWLCFVHHPPLRRAALGEAYRILLERDPAGDFCRRLSEGDASRLAILLAEISAAVADPPVCNAGLAFAAMTAWSMHLRAPPDVAGARIHPAVERAARMLAQGDPPLAEVAHRAGLSPSRLRHLFHEQTGTALTAYRNRQRLQRFTAAAAAAGRRRSLLDLALAAGFGSYQQFHRVFRAAYGVSPAAWVRGI